MWKSEKIGDLQVCSAWILKPGVPLSVHCSGVHGVKQNSEEVNLNTTDKYATA